MTLPNERSPIRLAVGFLAGIGVVAGGMAMAPRVAVLPSEDLTAGLEKAPKDVGAPQVVEKIDQNLEIVAPTQPQITQNETAPVVPRNEETVVATAKSEPKQADSEPQIVDPVMALVTITATSRTEFVDPESATAPNANKTPKATINVVKRLSALEDFPDAPPPKAKIAPPPPPQKDQIASTIGTEPPTIETVQADDKAAPQVPVIVALNPPTATLQAPTAATPEPADLPVRTNSHIKVSVNSFGKSPRGDEETTTRGLLAAVTGADRTPKLAVTTRVTPQVRQDAPNQAEATAPPAPPIATGPVFEAFAAQYTDSGEKALLAVILIDPGDDGMDRNFLKNLSFPVTFAVPAAGERAQFIDAEYREKGFEVLAMVPAEGEGALGRRARLSEVPDVMEIYRKAVPGAIGLMDEPNGQLHQNSRLLRALADELAVSGHAILTNKQRINNSDRIAQDAGIAFAKILRPIDADGSVPSIRRALERAALTASKAGGAVIVGNSDPQTIRTLYEWLLSNSARSIDVAPVSAVIKRLGQS